MSEVIVAPSLLACNKDDVKNQLSLMQQYGGQWLHFDVMDGIFVPNTSFSSDYLREISHYHHMVNDVHLMVEHPEDYIEDYVDAGANNITFHYESFYDDNERFDMIKRIKEKGCKVGMSVKPNTPISLIYQFIPELDIVLVMSVEPGFGGQRFIYDTPMKIRKVKKYCTENGYNNLFIAVDGGINKETGQACVESGANVLIAGSYLFGQDNIGERINYLKGRLK